MKAEMSAVNLIQCLAGEMFCHPADVVHAIQEDEEARALIRRYGRGEVSYEEVREAVNAIC